MKFEVCSKIKCDTIQIGLARKTNVLELQEIRIFHGFKFSCSTMLKYAATLSVLQRHTHTIFFRYSEQKIGSRGILAKPALLEQSPKSAKLPFCALKFSFSSTLQYYYTTPQALILFIASFYKQIILEFIPYISWFIIHDTCKQILRTFPIQAKNPLDPNKSFQYSARLSHRVWHRAHRTFFLLIVTHAFRTISISIIIVHLRKVLFDGGK